MPGEFVGYKAEIEKIEEAISKFSSERNINIAIISEPYAGKATLMDFICNKFRGIFTRINVSPHIGYLRVFEEAIGGDLSK